jgi:hypothetical protein
MRFVIVIFMCLTGIAIDMVLILRFHWYRAPLLVFAALMAIGYWIYRKVAASAGEKQWSGQLRAVRSVRWLACIYISGVIIFFVSGQYKLLPLWQEVLVLLIPALLCVLYLWIARRIEPVPEDA